MLPEAVTLTPRGELPSTGAYDGPRTGRGIRLGGKCTHQAGITAGGSPNGSPRTAVSHTGELNSASLLNGPIRLPLNGFTYS